MIANLDNFTDLLDDDIYNSQPISLPSSSTTDTGLQDLINDANISKSIRPTKRTGERGGLRSVEEIDPKYKGVFSYQYFNLVQSRIIEDALYSDKSMVVCAPTGSGKTVVFEMAIVQLLMEMDDKRCDEDFKIIYMAPIKALCTERLTEWYPKFTKLNLLCIEVTGDTDVDFSQLKPYRIIITTPEKWDMLTRRWRDNRGMVEVIKLFLIDEVHILNDSVRGPVLEAVVSRMKTIQSSVQSTHRIEQLQKQNQGTEILQEHETAVPKIRFVAVSATISNPEDVAEWLGTSNKPAVYYKFGDECRPVRLKRIVEGYPCPEGTSIFKFDIILNYKLWPIIQRYHDGKPTLIFCNTRKSVILTAETLSREITINFNSEQRAKLVALASVIKNKKVQSLVLCGVGCHHAGLLFEERTNIEQAFRNSDLPILITTTTLAMGVNLPAHLVIIKNTQQYVNGAYQEYSISTVLQMVGRAGRPQFDTEATAVIMTRLTDKVRYQALVGGCEPLQSFLHKRIAENLNSEAALGTVNDVAQCVQWLRSTFLFVRAARDPRKYLGLPQSAPAHHISKKIEELCVKAMNGLASSGLITMDEASCIESTEAGRLMSIYYLDLETMKHIMRIKGNESLEQLLWIVCESHELSDMHLRVDERRCLNALNRNNTAATIRFPMKGKISTRQMKLNCIIQAVLGCLPIHEPSLNQEAMKIMRIADRICKCLVAYVTRPNLLRESPQNYQAVLNSIVLMKCIEAHLWENSIYVSKQLKGIGPTFSTLLATAGKLNFMLLEESHPRDLERIMNKGPPAGNIIRKQISLLPKYQLTMTPVDEKIVKIRLTLLNQMHLAENMEHLTAGANHKCYIIIGDTENYLLSLTSFKDKDLISVYDGQIMYEIMRRHNYEHKIIAHCISSNFAGIDIQCEYIFKDLGILHTNAITHEEVNSKTKHIKQAAITDTFKVRKRKTCDVDVTCLKEKKKRDYSVIQKFKSFKKSFGESCNIMNEVINKEADKTYGLHGLTELKNVTANAIKNDNTLIGNKNNTQTIELKETHQSYGKINDENYKEEDHINSIICEIENEIHNYNSQDVVLNKKLQAQCNNINITKTINTAQHFDVIKNYNEFRNKTKNKEKSNFNVIDIIERKTNVNDCDDLTILNNNNTFADTVKSQIDKYIEKTQQSANLGEKNIMELLDIKSFETLSQEKIDSLTNDIDLLSNIKKRKVGNGVISTGINILNRINDYDKLPRLLDNSDLDKNELEQEQNENGDSKDKKLNAINLADTKQNFVLNRMKGYETARHLKPFSNYDDSLSRNPCIFNNIVNSKLSETKYRIDLPMANDYLKSSNLVSSFPLTPITNSSVNSSLKTSEIENIKECNEVLSNNDTILQPNISNYVNSEMSEIDCTKMYSFTKTQFKIYSDTHESNFCMISKLEIDVDIMGNKFKIQEEKDTLLKIKPHKDQNEIKCPNIKSLQYKCDNIFNIDTPSEKSSVNNNHNDICERKQQIQEEVSKEEDNVLSQRTNASLENTIPENTSSFEQNHDTVKDIIHKYKKIISSKINATEQLDSEMLCSSTGKTGLRQCEKIIRPYNITDLPSLEQPNSPNQYSVSVSQPTYFKFEAKMSSRTENPNVEINKNRRNRKELIINTELVPSKEKLLLKSPVQEISIGKIDSPQFKQSELIDEDFDMSQTMFNPKVLLECLKQDDIIPPPSQFRDDKNTVSPDRMSRIFDMKSSSSEFNMMSRHKGNNIDMLEDLNINVFEENQDVVVTPTKEIETWTLSRDDEMYTHPYKCFTTISNNSAMKFSPQIFSTRKAKLN